MLYAVLNKSLQLHGTLYNTFSGTLVLIAYRTRFGLRFKCLSRSYPDTLRYVVSRRSGRAPSMRALTRRMGG